MKYLSSLITGLLFGIGLGLSGMMSPEKVINFLDVTGTWDPSLALVMGGALMVTLISFPLVLKRKHPLFEKEFFVPQVKEIDHFVTVGPAIFGIGWGLSGICPGPGIANLATFSTPVFAYVGTMFAFLLVTDVFMDIMKKRKS